MHIQNNLLGLYSLNRGKINRSNLEKSIKKLSSGYRINKASDDGAGLVISQKMISQIRGLKMANRNASDAYSLMEARDGALDEVQHILQRMRELAVESLNDTLTDDDRMKLQQEFRNLQICVSEITKESQLNQSPIFEAHQSSFYYLEGNNRFTKPIKIIDGFNNDLEISVDGNVIYISIDEGNYTIEEIVDIIDDKLMEKNQNLIINLTKNNTVSIQSENSSSIDYIKGGLSFLFYEYQLGTPPGMLIGVTEFMENGRLNIKVNSNDRLTFYVGADKQYTIKFTPKTDGYTIDELIDVINNQLEEQGETDVKAIKFSNKHIALYSNKYVITGLSGNMIKIDGITSVLYDNSKHGYINKSTGYVLGRKDLTSGIIIERDKNDILILKTESDSDYKVINFLDDGEDSKFYTFDELINRINNEAKNKQIGITAMEISIGDGKKVLRINSNYYGDKSKVIVDENSNAYKDLFVDINEYTLMPIETFGQMTQAYIRGKYVLDEVVNIQQDVNDTFIVTVDGKSVEIRLQEGEYSIYELVSEINSQFMQNSIDATAESIKSSNDNKYALVIKNNKLGEGTINISEETNGFKSLFCQTYLSELENIKGKTTVIEPEEGIVDLPVIIETPAVLVGKVDLTYGVKIDSNNDILSFNMSGQNITIELDHGQFSAEELCNMIGSKLSDKGVIVSLERNTSYGLNLVFTTQNKGDGQYFSDIGGTAYSTILALKLYDKPEISKYGISTSYSIVGRGNIDDNFVIDESNNDLSFYYVDDGNKYEINIVLDNRNYSKADLISELNNRIQEKLKENGLSGDEIAVSLENSRIKMSLKNAGSNYKLEEFSGGFYNSVLKSRNVSESYPYTYSGYSTIQVAYIVGRVDLNSEIEIHPLINDVLIFDFYHGNHKETFELTLNPGIYNANSIVKEIQDRLDDELVKKGYEAGMIKVQIGGVDSGTAVDDKNKLVILYEGREGINDNGTYIIDGVRGSAAYTVFYKAEGEPSPTHIVGVVDLSNGVFIQTGVNDTLVMDINGKSKTITLEAKYYTPEELLNTLNEKLKQESTNVVASYYEGRLKLSFKEVGLNSIDGIRGNARGTLFFKEDSRELDQPEHFMIGPNSGDNLVLDKPRISAELMRINTITIHKADRAKKALERLDNAIDYTSSVRSQVGVIQNRLSFIIKNNENYEENLSQANSRIQDLDMAKEIMEFTRQQILQQTTQMILIQANHNPDLVLKLLE